MPMMWMFYFLFIMIILNMMFIMIYNHLLNFFSMYNNNKSKKSNMKMMKW